MIYFDTAYLLKCYLKEPGWAEVRELAGQHERVACSIYGKMELHAELHRKLREREITKGQLALTESVVASVLSELKNLPGRLFVRTADALHLVTAKDKRFREIYSNDTHLLAAAPHFGIEGLNVIAGA